MTSSGSDPFGAASRMIDWEVAVRVGSGIAGDGPVVPRAEAAAVVSELRAGAQRATGLVRDFTGLEATNHDAPVLVVDRPGWIRANAGSFATLLGPVVDELAARRGDPSGLARAIGSRVTGAEVGALLGFLSTKVLGQFDPFTAPDGRLLLVAPNIVQVEQELQADPSDFRLWVCLHEETHRVQFTAVPWLRDHLLAEVHQLAAGVEPTRFLDEGLARITEAVTGGGSMLDLFASPEQKVIIERLTGIMSLLEGHADVVMDGVGPSVIPSVDRIRSAFNRRRKGKGSLDRLIRRVLGLEAKMAQYRDGARFVRAVVGKVGMADFNAVWERPEHLPSMAEIADPPAWISRVL